MSVEIKEKEVGGNIYKNLKFSRTALPAEHVLVEKVYDEPVTGESSFGPYYNYMFRVNKLVSLNPTTAQLTELTDLGEASMFATEKLHEKIKNIGTNQEFKIYKAIVQGKKGEYTVFEVDLLEETPTTPAATPDNVSADAPWKDNAATLLNNKVDKEIVKAQVKRNFDVNDDDLDIFVDDYDI